MMSPSDLVPIPGGEFLMGQNDGRDDERPAHRVTVFPFRMSRFQVTNADYAAFRKFEFSDPALPAAGADAPGGTPRPPWTPAVGGTVPNPWARANRTATASSTCARTFTNGAAIGTTRPITAGRPG